MTGNGEPTFEWDAENRLVSVTITATGHRSEFGYDGLGRRVQIRELDPDATTTLQVTSDKKYLWDGVEIAEERTGTDGGAVSKRFYSQGFVDSDGTILYYTRDHLGSIRELTDSSQTVRARYDYDPYGRMTKVSGDRDSVFGFTGYFWHAQSGLDLTYYRAYDPNLGRWISRDPIGIVGGINLYAFCFNNGVNYVDRDGRLIIGAIVGGVFVGLTGYISSGGNWGAAAAGALSGSVIGALDPTEVGAAGYMAAGFIAGAAGDYLGQGINNKINGKGFNDCINGASTVGSAIGGAAGAGLGWGGANYAAGLGGGEFSQGLLGGLPASGISGAGSYVGGQWDNF